jgi:1-acyl-sn-glycerol-3-phosphate acyltransferase
LYIFTIKIKKLRQNNLIEIDAKFAEMIEKNKKEQEETKKEYKEEVKKELEKVLNRDNKNIEDLNKK